jgi:hypothetical protein
MDALLKYTIEQWPELTRYLALLVVLLAFIGIPVGLWFGIRKWLSKDRYVFTESKYHLSLLFRFCHW